MQIFLVRHGETDGNVAHRHQVERTPLTTKGKEQAREVAERLESLKPTRLLTSKLVRAIETARIIGEVCNLTPETSENFVELKRPNHLYGRYHKSAHSLWFYFWWFLGLKRADKNGESYAELRQRFLKAKAELAGFAPEDKVVVVSHAAFMALFTAHLCRNKKLSLFQATKTFYRIITMPNTAVIEIEYEHKSSYSQTDGKGASKKSSCLWRVNKYYW